MRKSFKRKIRGPCFVKSNLFLFFRYFTFSSYIYCTIVVELENFQRNSSKVSFLSSSSLRITESTASMTSSAVAARRNKNLEREKKKILINSLLTRIYLLLRLVQMVTILYSICIYYYPLNWINEFGMSYFCLSLFRIVFLVLFFLFSFIEITFLYSNSLWIDGNIFEWFSVYLTPHYLSKLLSSI